MKGCGPMGHRDETPVRSAARPRLRHFVADLIAAESDSFSAFDLAGQKRSSASRVLATPGIYDSLVDGLAQKARTLCFDEP